MQKKKVFQLLVDNTTGVLSRVAGLFSRRGYNIESISAGVTADPRITRITVVTSGDDDILEQIEKQVAKLVDVRDIHELKPEESVYRELAMIKVKADVSQRDNVITLANIFRGNVIDVSEESLLIEATGNSGKIDALLRLLSGYEILELARTGVAGLGRGTKNIIMINPDGQTYRYADGEPEDFLQERQDLFFAGTAGPVLTGTAGSLPDTGNDLPASEIDISGQDMLIITADSSGGSGCGNKENQ